MPNDCILYTGTLTPEGYGRTSFNGKTTGAHRIAWMQEYGPIPNGLWVLHSCDNPPCINIEHLRLGTAKENYQDMVERNRTGRPIFDQCFAGHTLGKNNTLLGDKGEKQCRSCEREERKRQLPALRIQLLREALCI